MQQFNWNLTKIMTQQCNGNLFEALRTLQKRLLALKRLYHTNKNTIPSVGLRPCASAVHKECINMFSTGLKDITKRHRTKNQTFVCLCMTFLSGSKTGAPGARVETCFVWVSDKKLLEWTRKVIPCKTSMEQTYHVSQLLVPSLEVLGCNLTSDLHLICRNVRLYWSAPRSKFMIPITVSCDID